MTVRFSGTQAEFVALFRGHAAEARRRSTNRPSSRQREECKIEARIWEQAAHILENTVIKDPSGEGISVASLEVNK